VAYLVARIEAEMQDLAYRIYVTDALKFCAENTARIVGKDGACMAKRFYDILCRNSAAEDANPREVIEKMVSSGAITIMNRKGRETDEFV
jgi:hypothetical protein